ncbi:MAG: DMT family transporter [Candidatus Nitrosopolaris sp.]
MIGKSWIVFIQAIILSFESIIVEFLTEIPGISSLLVAGISIPIAGGILLLAQTVLLNKKITVFRSWKLLLSGSIFLAAAVFLWYDSVTRVGASKEGLLAGPLETVVVLILAWLFLKEKLRKRQLVGVIIALSGFFATVSSSSLQLSLLLSIPLTFGDFEAILSAFTFAAGVIFMTKLVERHSSIEVSGASLFISGLILAAILILWTSSTSRPEIGNWIFLISFSLVPLAAAFLYVVGLSRIGASLTSTLASSNILFTLLFQLLFRGFGIKTNLPENILLAVIGGALGVFGIYLIHAENNNKVNDRDSDRA